MSITSELGQVFWKKGLRGLLSMRIFEGAPRRRVEQQDRVGVGGQVDVVTDGCVPHLTPQAGLENHLPLR